jgi:hypothetical protein
LRISINPTFWQAAYKGHKCINGLVCLPIGEEYENLIGIEVFSPLDDTGTPDDTFQIGYGSDNSMAMIKENKFFGQRVIHNGLINLKMSLGLTHFSLRKLKII